MRRALVVLGLSLLLLSCHPSPGDCTAAIPSREAGKHIGEEKWVICRVVFFLRAEKRHEGRVRTPGSHVH